MKVTILNSSLITAEGTFQLKEISIEDAKETIKDGFISAIGHESTATIVSTLLGVTIPMNRVIYTQATGEQALIFKLNGRAEEGKILTIGEIEEIGFKFQLLTKIK